MNFHEQTAQFFFQIRTHDRRFNPQLVFDERNMLIIFIVAELLENLFRLLIGHALNRDSFFFNLGLNVFDDTFGNLRGFFGLKLSKNLPKMVNPFIGIKADFIRRIFIGRLLIFNQQLKLTRTQVIITNHDTFIIHMDKLPDSAFFTYRIVVDVGISTQKRFIDVF